MTKATIEQEVVRTETEDLFICDECSREVDDEGTALVGVLLLSHFGWVVIP